MGINKKYLFSEQLAEIRKIWLSRLLCDGGDNIQTLQLKAMEIPDYEECVLL